MSTGRYQTDRVLWLPEYVYRSQYNADRYKRLADGYVKVFRSQAEVALEPDPDWVADPLQSQTWRLYYHGLTWLLAAAWGVDHSDDPEAARTTMAEVISSYLDSNVFGEAQDMMAWDDHATADRLATISYLWERYLSAWGVPAPADMDRAVAIHVQRLVGYYDSEKWIASNHGLFHALALLDFAIVFESHPASDQAQQIGGDYLRRTIEAIIDRQDGISTEQSIHYHQFALRSMRSMKPFLAANHSELDRLVDSIIDGMVDFNLCIRGTSNAMPAIGDTRVFDRIPADCLTTAEGESSSPYLEHIESDGANGIPFQDLVVYRRSGIAVFREGEPPGRVSRAVFTCHPERIAHGHFDALSVTLHLQGLDILIDSGGPYAYGEYLRFGYFVASRAHNVLLIDGHDHQSAAEIRAHGVSEGIHWVSGEHRGYQDRTVTRTVAWDPGVALAVFDRVSAAGRISRYELLWHLPPGSEFTHQSMNRSLATSIDRDSAPLAASETIGSADLSVEIVEGVLEPHPQGWITEQLGEKRPAPVQIVSSEADDFSAVTAFALTPDAAIAAKRGDDLAVQMAGKWFTIDPDGSLVARD